MSDLEVAELYFNLSNKSDLSAIEELMTGGTTYVSQNTGTYQGVKDIMAMQKAFHRKFKSLSWTVNSVKEVKPGIILFDYDFMGELPDGKKVESSGLEYLTVAGGKIERVEIRNKAK